MEHNFVTVRLAAQAAGFSISRGGTRISRYARVLENTHIGDGCKVGKDVFVDSRVRIGNNVIIHNGAYIHQDVTIESGVIIGSGVVLGEPQRGTNAKNQPGPIRIGYRALIGDGAIILPGVTIGRFASIRPGAVVTSDVPSHALMSGAPAQQVGFVCKCSSQVKETGRGHFRCPECGDKYYFAMPVKKSLLQPLFYPLRLWASLTSPDLENR